MIAGEELLDGARAGGFDFFSGVPCSLMSSLIRAGVEHEAVSYVGATNEGEATAIAVGAWLAGARSGVITQNSGLGNIVNPLSSLAWPARIPLLILCSLRGAPGAGDEPQHELMGRVTEPLMELLEVDSELLPAGPETTRQRLTAIAAAMDADSRSRAMIVGPESLEPDDADRPWPRSASPRGGEVRGEPVEAYASRGEALETIVSALPDDALVVATTGKTARELFAIADSPRHLYHVGAMGSASATALGVALRTDHPVVVLDGDGAALMRMGTLATIGALAPPNLTHVLLDNGSHDSTGGQPTSSPSVDFPAVAVACGYPGAAHVASLADLVAELEGALAGGGPRLLRVPIATGSPPRLGRPTIAPDVVARRFREAASA